MVEYTQGGQANRTGKALETFIENILLSSGYEKRNGKLFMPAIYLEQPIYSRQFKLRPSVYNHDYRCDFMVYHPEKHPNCLIIEAKWQHTSGSVDEKFPYFVMNLKKFEYKSIIVLDGDGYKRGAKKWLDDQVDDKLLHVFNMSEFQSWAMNDNI